MVYVANIVVVHTVRFNVRGIAIILVSTAEAPGAAAILFLLSPPVSSASGADLYKLGLFFLEHGIHRKDHRVHAVRFNIHRMSLFLVSEAEAPGQEIKLLS